MALDNTAIMQLSDDDKRTLAFELLDSIDEAYINKPLPDWMSKLIDKRLDAHKKNPDEVTPWSEVREKYFAK